METLIKFLTAIFVAIAEVLKLNKAGRKVVAIADMYDEMNAVLTPEGINRILIMWYHNSGGVISADKPLYITCIHEVKIDEIDSVKKKYKGLEIDHAAARIIGDIFVHKNIELQTDHMKKSILKKIFQDEEVVRAKQIFVKHTSKGLWFVSFRTSNSQYNFSEDEVEIASIVSNIKRTI